MGGGEFLKGIRGVKFRHRLLLAIMDYGSRYGLARKLGLDRGWPIEEIRSAARNPELLAGSELKISNQAK